MSEEEINVAIAECCGWDTDPIESHPWTSRGQWVVKPWNKKRELCSKIMNMPRYCGDLNAMHEAEKVLLIGDTKQVIHATNRYTNELCKLLGCMDTALFLFTHATAAQRAEAFLRTLGKWRE